MKKSLFAAAILSVATVGAANAQFAAPSTDPREWIIGACLAQGHSPGYCQCWSHVALGSLSPEAAWYLMGQRQYAAWSWQVPQAEQKATATCGAQFGR